MDRMDFVAMKKFNKNKYLKQLELKRLFRKYERYFYIGIPCLLVGILGIYFAYSKFTTTSENEVIRTTVGKFIAGDVLINIYVNGEYSAEVPEQGGFYKVNNISCDNGAVGEWDVRDWGPTITNVTKRSKCNIYFVDADTVTLGNTKFVLDAYDSCPSLNSDNSANATEIEDAYGYLCKSKDDYGDSYYFRGDVINNYVKFGKWSEDAPSKFYGYYSETSSAYQEYDSLGACQNASSYNKNCTEVSYAGKDMYWRIVRINGDGTVRVIYDGTSAHNNSDTTKDRIIGSSAFNESYDDNANVGYMYGNPKSSSYFETHDNNNDSTIKKFLENWYKTNLSGTDYENYIVDKVFCNDRSLSSGEGHYVESDWGDDGYTNYGTGKITLTCPNYNDRFTYDYGIGNGRLNYKIGLLTYNEAVLGGIGTGHIDYDSYYPNKTYLYSGDWYWTMSPESYDGRYASEYFVGEYHDAWERFVNSKYGVKPVINLDTSILSSGDGSATNPFHLS